LKRMTAAAFAASVAIGAALATPSGGGAGSTTSVIDLTFMCQMPAEGFPDSTRFMAVAALRDRRHGSPIISASNGPSFELRAMVVTGASGRLATGAVVVNEERCTEASFGVPLSADGLRRARSGAPNTYRCAIPATVLMRVRANFKRPTGFARDERFAPSVTLAKGPIATAYLAITTVRGRKPLAFASVNDASGRARLFVAPSRCRVER
jgi:hypothetical protein